MTTQYFRSFSAGASTITADIHGSDLILVEGANISLTANEETGQLTIAASGDINASLPITQDNSTNATNYLVFSSSATGDLFPRTDTGLYYNPFTNTLTAGVFNGPSSSWSTARTVSFSGGDVTGSFSIDGTTNVSNVVLSLAGGGSGYVLPTATTSVLGGVKIDGTTVTIDGNGVISCVKTTSLIGGNNTTLLGSIGYQSNLDTTTLLAPNTTITKKYLSQTGTGTNGAVPAWETVTAVDVGLGNVTNESKATMFSSPTFTGTVSGVTATHVGLGNVTNESKATMFDNPTFTGTVSGLTVSASSVGLGNVTNESKATMFSSPTFTGTVSGVTATHVGLGNVTNESKATMFSSPTFTGTVTLSQSVETFTSPSISANAVTLNFNLGAIFALGSNAANITANFTNIPGTSGQTISTTLIITQGGTAYIPSAVTINGGGSVTPKWQGGSAPSGVANRVNIVSFTFVCTATNTWTVIGSLTDYN
jgi:hypothetical protein